MDHDRSVLASRNDENGVTLQRLLIIAGAQKIKEKKILWNFVREHTATYFILPQEPSAAWPISGDIMSGRIKLKMKDFVGFWRDLDDLYKERRFLVYFMCCLRTMGSEFDIEEKQDDYECPPNAAFSTEILWIIRRLWIERQRDTGTNGFQITAIRFLSSFLKGPDKVSQLAASDLFVNAFETEFIPDNCLVDLSTLLFEMMRNIVKVYCTWLALNPVVLRKQYEDKHHSIDQEPEDGEMSSDRFVKKMRVAAPHWRQKDRAFILRAIAMNGESSKGDYVGRLINAVGMDRFKLIAFGKEKFCANCCRSSYVGEEQLWCCKRCIQERKKPKARYCNVECLRAHWVKHKAEMHSG